MKTQPLRTPSKLSDSFHRQLNMYALAASAAGVSILALAQPVGATVVYTKTHHVIGTNGIYNLDLNHDGIIDFLILESGSPLGSTNSLLAKEAFGNAVEGSQYLAAALKPEARIGRGDPFFVTAGRRGAIMARTFCSTDGTCGWLGQWKNVTNRYLGLRFKIQGKTHYGWARLTVRLPGKYLIKATLTGYAYETEPGKSIQAGQTADAGANATMSLGRLALGAGGVAPKTK